MADSENASISKSSEVHAWQNVVSGLVLVLVFLVTVSTLLLALRDAASNIESTGDPFAPFRHIYWMLYNGIVSPSAATVLFYLGLPILLVLQGVFPAVKGEGALSRNLLCDLCWMLMHGWMVATMIWTFLVAAEQILGPWTEPVRLGLLSQVPAWMEVIIGYLLIELLGWFNHLLRHKINVLWVFHEVHHSQRKMNPLTLFRVHPVDYLMAEVIILLPSVFFEETLGIVLAYLTISRVHDALTHSNIKTNLGWLRYVFVTPQSHRVHHSVEPAYFDMNYGVTLSIWDRLFGTHSPSDFVYPRTGIPDENFPLESERPVAQLPVTLLAQLGYPFVKAVRKAWSPRDVPNQGSLRG